MEPHRLTECLPSSLDYTLLQHNGQDLKDYPEHVGWQLVPFPMQKGQVYSADNLATVNRHEFLLDSDFAELRASSEARWSKANLEIRDIAWRLKVFEWAVRISLDMWSKTPSNTGIFLECGTGLGYMASALLRIRSRYEVRPDVYLADSFSSYLPDDNGFQSARTPEGFGYASSPDDLQDLISVHQSVYVVEGDIPKSLDVIGQREVSFLHLDLNSHMAESAVADWLTTRLGDSFVLLMDDHGGPGGAKQASVHESLADRLGVPLLPLPTGQALIVSR